VKIAVINLASDHQKRERAETILKDMKLDYFIFNAIYGKSLPTSYLSDVELNSNWYFTKIGKKLNPGEIGLYLSHVQLYKWLISTDEECLCILEDDFDLSISFKSVLDEIHSFLEDANFDILMLGHFLNRKDKGITGSIFHRIKGISFTLEIPLEPNWGTHAYIITKTGAKMFLARFSEPKCPIDHVLGVAEVFNIRRRILSKPIVFQSELFGSGIQSESFTNENILLFKIKYLIKKIIFSLNYQFSFKRMKHYAQSYIECPSTSRL
jgi:glycosyl transferase family 25